MRQRANTFRRKGMMMISTVSVHPAAVVFWTLVVSFIAGFGAHAGWALIEMFLR